MSRRFRKSLTVFRIVHRPYRGPELDRAGFAGQTPRDGHRAPEGALEGACGAAGASRGGKKSRAGARRGRGRQRGDCAVEPRTTSSGSNSSSPGGTAPPWICAHSSSTAARPMASMGWRTVVSGGSVQFMKAESS